MTRSRMKVAMIQMLRCWMILRRISERGRRTRDRVCIASSGRHRLQGSLYAGLLLDFAYISSKATPGSSSKGRNSSDLGRDVQPYQIRHPQTLSARFSQVFSTPNLHADRSKPAERRLRRSHSATSIDLPALSPLSPLRLPSLKTHDQEGVPWSVALSESLRLSQFPVPPRHVTPQPSKRSLKVHVGSQSTGSKAGSQYTEATAKAAVMDPEAPQRTTATQSTDKDPSTPVTVVQIRVQEPTSLTTPRTSASIRGTAPENAPPAPQDTVKQTQDDDEEDNPRRSVHLYSMRISHHLRSGSLLSWDNLADAPELPNLPRTFRDRSVSDLSRVSQGQKQLSRHVRQTSSSGFASSKVPGRWGRVVPHEFREDKSSVYSSRPQSPPDSFGESMINLSKTATRHHASKDSSVDLTKPRRSHSFPTDNEETPRPIRRHGLTNLHDKPSIPMSNRRSTESARLARNNSVASTKKSKFREEFSPSPPKKKVMQSASIMRFLNPKRSSMRSQSEANLRSDAPEIAVDGSLETPRAGAQRERRLSKSMVSIQAEQAALGKDKKASPVWERALQNYQDERACMFLSENKDLVTQSSPFRERSGSVARSMHSNEEEQASSRKLIPAKRFSAPVLDPPAPGKPGPEYPPSLFSRRTAFIGRDMDDISPSREVQACFDKQTDVAETVGAWGRYPSHTRPERTLSAGHLDNVDARDFALEAAIKFAMGKDSDPDDDLIDPTARLPSPPLLRGEKKRKKRIGNTRMAKSHSMTFGKTFFKNYTRMFRSQSIEFSKHGRGHRSSITTGGTLEHPELEMLPQVWMRGPIDERNGEHSGGSNESQGEQEEYGVGDRKGKGKLKDGNSLATLRAVNSDKARRNSSMARLDGQVEEEHSKDTARVMSTYYESFIPAFPRASTEADFGLEDFGVPSRHSFESRRASLRSRTVPARFSRHSRNASRMSRLSVVSRTSAKPSFVSAGDDEVGMEARSIVSVRRSTMDLINMYKEQENTERERVLSLMRVESQKENQGITAL